MTPTPHDPSKERNAFELAALAAGVNEAWLRYSDDAGVYSVDYIQLAWRLWLARANQQASAQWIACRAVEAGIIHTVEGDESYTTPLGILLEFRTKEDVREALKTDFVHFDFGKHPEDESEGALPHSPDSERTE